MLRRALLLCAAVGLLAGLTTLPIYAQDEGNTGQTTTHTTHTTTTTTHRTGPVTTHHRTRRVSRTRRHRTRYRTIIRHHQQVGPFSQTTTIRR